MEISASTCVKMCSICTPIVEVFKRLAKRKENDYKTLA